MKMAWPWGRPEEGVKVGRGSVQRLSMLVVLVAVISALHYLTQVHEVHYHDIYRRLYYIPILLGGLWFSLRGGVTTAVAVSFIYLPHVVIQWQSHPTERLDQYLEIILYNIIGALTGCLAGRERTLRLSYQSAADRLEKSYAQLRDQADQIMEIEEQLRRADRMAAMGELTAGLAHEIRNPLGSIRMAAEVVQEAIDPSDRRYEFSRILIKEVSRLNQVMEEFLQFARPTPAEKKRMDLNAVLDEVLQLLAPQAKEQGVEILSTRSELPLFSGEPVQLRQAFLNLALNAVQAMPEGGTLTVSSLIEGGAAQVRFADTGSGIAQEDLSRVFDPFFTRREGGTGLGLAITYRIVEGHGGRIEAESCPGKGSVFTVSLPLPGEED